MSSPASANLKVVIVGAGIAGLASAISFRRAGHHVEIYERSSLNNELGAAIHVCPNASRGLLAWGLDPVRGRFVTAKKSYRAKGPTLEKFHESDEGYIVEQFGAPWFFAHRVDLHEELKILATGMEGEGRPAVVHLSSGVVGYDSEAGTITLGDGTVVAGDLIVAADGVHSSAVAAVLGAPNPARSTFHFAYRLLIPSKEIAADPETSQFAEGDDGQMKFMVGDGKRIVWYPCRNNEEHNFVAIFHDETAVTHEDWHTPVDKAVLLDRYSDFHPSILAVLSKAKDIKQWPLLYRGPISTWHKGKIVLVGDAAHPMLPHQGQGGAQAIEDGLALGIAFSNLPDSTLETMQNRLKLFEQIRVRRASVMQVFSNAGQEEPAKIHDEAAKFIGAENVPKGPEEFFKYNFGYDVVKDSEKALRDDDPTWRLPQRFFSNRKYCS